MSFHNEIKVKHTRKTRKCDWCDEPIQKGDPSVYTAGVYDGDFYTGRYHPECSEACARWYSENDCWGEPMPDEIMNRGGIKLKGEPETNMRPNKIQEEVMKDNQWAQQTRTKSDLRNLIKTQCHDQMHEVWIETPDGKQHPAKFFVESFPDGPMIISAIPRFRS